MKNIKLLSAIAFTSFALLAGCGSDSGSNSNSETSKNDVPEETKFSVSSCEEVTDPDMSAKLEIAKSNISEIFMALGDKDLESAQAMSASNKDVFATVLKQYPGNCEAQLGYAISIITDLLNNKVIKGAIDSVTNKKKFLDLDVEDFNKYLINADGTKLSDQIQKAVVTAIPSVDSAIIYMKNVVADEDFVCHYTFEERTYELDRGEFAPALAALYVVKSMLTLDASLNTDFSNNGNFDWLNDFYENMEQDSVSNETQKFIEKLLSKSSSFTTVYTDWIPKYKSIPSMLDSAISYVQMGLQYGIDESKNGSASQLNDPYIVSDDEMSDVSPSDFQKAIDSLERYRKSLHEGVEIELPGGSKITINLGKFFEITDGWQQFFPYHKVNDVSTWLIPEDGNYFWNENLTYYSYASRYIENYAESFYKKNLANARNSSVWADLDDYYDPAQLYISAETTNGTRTYDYFDVTLEGCTVSFARSEKSYYYEDRKSSIEKIPAIKLRSEFCKVEGGETQFATAFGYTKSNYITFTDASGKKTISWQTLQNGHVVDEELVDYNLDDLKKFIIFPDITFGGILPDMTVDKFWDVLKTEIRYANEDDDDWYYDDDVYYYDWDEEDW